MSIFHQYWGMKAREKMEREQKDRDYRSDQFQSLNQRTTTTHTSIPNMEDAYRRVRSSGHKPTEGEIHFRRFTSGSWVDSDE
jgi:hypothetical protein